MKRTQKGSDLEVTSLSRRFWPQTDNSTLQTQYCVPTGPAGMRVAVYAMGSSSSSSRQSVGRKNGEKPQCMKGRKPSVRVGGSGTDRASSSKLDSVSYEAFLDLQHLPCPVTMSTRPPHQADIPRGSPAEHLQPWFCSVTDFQGKVTSST